MAIDGNCKMKGLCKDVTLPILGFQQDTFFKAIYMNYKTCHNRRQHRWTLHAGVWLGSCLLLYSEYAWYFDTYVLPPLMLETMAYLQCHSISGKLNRHRLQCLTSNVCWHYCCIYASHRVQELSMTSFVEFKPARLSSDRMKAVWTFRVHSGVSRFCYVDSSKFKWMVRISTAISLLWHS